MTTCVKHGAVGRGGEAAATNCIPLYNNVIPNVVRNLCLRRFSLNITVVIFAIFAFSSCCRGEELGRYEVTEAHKQLIPYKDGQVVSFIDGEGHTVDLTVIGSESSWYRHDVDGGNMCSDYIMFKVEGVHLESETNNIRIGLAIGVYDYFYRNYNGLLEVTIRPDNVVTIWQQFRLFSDAEGNFLTDSPLYLTENYKSLEINGKVYYEVVEQKYNSTVYDGRGGQSKVFFQLFYNKTYGILQINRDGENFLTINSKENNSPDSIDCIYLQIADTDV